MADTSSYNYKVDDPLEKANQYGGLEQQRIAISRGRVQEANEQFATMFAMLSTLAKTNPPKDVAAREMTKVGQAFNMPPNIINQMLHTLNTAPDVRTWATENSIRGAESQQRFNQIYGDFATDDTGQTLNHYQRSQTGGITRNYPPIQKEIPPTSPVFNPLSGQMQMQGPTVTPPPPGRVAAPTNQMPFSVSRPVPTQRILPPQQQQQVQPQSAPNAGPGGSPEPLPFDASRNLPTTNNERVAQGFPAPSGPATGMPPLFEEGKKKFTEDQQNAMAKMFAAKPAIQSLPLMNTPGFLSGPLTDQFTNVVAALKSTGLIDIKDENDPTAIRQEVVKKLAQYVSGSPVGQRSDAAQTLKEAASPSPKVQLLPALIKLTKDAIALDRIEAALPNSFKDKDLSKYGSYRASFPQSIDEKAFTLDLEPEDKSKRLVDSMEEKFKNPKSQREKNEAIKFLKSLRIAKENGFYQ